jgi:hypothetical protein
MENKLKGASCYLCGPIDFATDDGYGWRDQITPTLKEMGIKILNPLDKPIIGYLEDPDTREVRREKQASGDFEYVFNQRDTRAIDLRMVDHCDFMVVKYDPNDRPFGTIEELTWGNRLKRPIIVVTPGGAYKCSPWLIWCIGWRTIFGEMDDAIDYIKKIDSGEIDGGKRWIFFKHI